LELKSVVQDSGDAPLRILDEAAFEEDERGRRIVRNERAREICDPRGGDPPGDCGGVREMVNEELSPDRHQDS
jgi:hypothetical protein